MAEEKEKLDHMINFRTTDKMYKDLIAYLKKTGESLSMIMRQATYDYLKFKKVCEENGYGVIIPIKKKKVEEKVNAPPQEIMYCDSDHCEVPPDYMRKKDGC